MDWWQEGIVYQVYPRSFQDCDGDGIGDLVGLRKRLGHLADLGVDAVWLSPIFPSPMADFGYDVADHCGVDPMFGTLKDFDDLLAEAHRRGLKLILDYVPNHTSDTHPWFVESRASRDGPRRDWYIWRDGSAGHAPPNNWLSEFGGPAWTFDERTGQHYYHAYLSSQPDLNWRNPEVQEAMLAVLRFWCERGVDGFRVDAIHHLFEDEALRDNPPDPYWRPGQSPARSVLRDHTMDLAEVQDAVAAMRRVTDGYGGRVLIGEAYLPLDRLMAYYGAHLTGFHMPFNFHLIKAAWEPRSIAAFIEAYEAALPSGAWPNWVLGNHDRSRVASRIGPEQARVAAVLLLTLRGTPTIYQGEELGLADVPIAPALVQDPWEKKVPGLGFGRDPVRTPMPWTGETNCGFTTGRPWLPLGAGAAAQSVEVQSRDAGSMLSLYRRLIALRRREPALSRGAYMPCAATEQVIVYDRHDGRRRLRVALNMTGSIADCPVSLAGEVVLTTAGDAEPAKADTLAPNEARIVAPPDGHNGDDGAPT